MAAHTKGYALVTGASTGIGYELAKLIAKDGKNLVIVARSEDKLEALKTEIESQHGVSVLVLPKDLSDPKAPDEIFSEVEQAGIRVDLLVNNAGFGVYGKFADTDLQKELELIQVNATSLIHLTKLFLKGMVENGSGRILNVASLCSFLSAPMESVYCATKALVLHFSEALANELQGTGVSVTCLCPGLAETCFHKNAKMDHTKAAQRKMMSAASVAEAGYKGLKKGKMIVIPGLIFRTAPWFARVVPRKVVTRVVRSQHEPA